MKKLLSSAFVLSALMAQPALADHDDRKSVVIRQGNDTLILKTSPEAASRIQKMIKEGDNVVIRLPRSGYYYYPDDYYPYYRNHKNPTAYSVGRAVGRELDD